MRVGSTGFEDGSTDNYSSLTGPYGATPGSISGAAARNGARGFTHFSDVKPIGYTFSSISQAEGGYHLRTTNTGAGNVAVLWVVKRADGLYNDIVWDITAASIRIRQNNTAVASVDDGALTATLNTWIFCGFSYKSALSGGWFTLYLNNSPVVSYTGDLSSQNIVAAYGGGDAGGSGWGGGGELMDMDNLFVNTSDSDVDKKPPEIEIEFISVASTVSAAWTPEPNTVTNNHENVDEYPSDNDASYNFANAASLVDTYKLATVSLPAGKTVSSIRPFIVAKYGNDNVVPGDWWDFGTPLVAYKPIGAASQADSKTDLTGNGNSITSWNGTEPTWASGTGWSFSGIGAYFVGGSLGVGKGYTIAIRFSGAPNDSTQMLGANDSNTLPEVQITPYSAINNNTLAAWGNENLNMGSSTGVANAVLVMNEDGLYRNGVLQVPSVAPDWGDGAGVQTLTLTLGGRNIGIIVASRWSSGNILAFAMYSDKLSSGDIATLSANMASLS